MLIKGQITFKQNWCFFLLASEKRKWKMKLLKTSWKNHHQVFSFTRLFNLFFILQLPHPMFKWKLDQINKKKRYADYSQSDQGIRRWLTRTKLWAIKIFNIYLVNVKKRKRQERPCRRSPSSPSRARNPLYLPFRTPATQTNPPETKLLL